MRGVEEIVRGLALTSVIIGIPSTIALLLLRPMMERSLYGRSRKASPSTPMPKSQQMLRPSAN